MNAQSTARIVGLFKSCAEVGMKSSSTSATKVIRVLIADDHPVVREGLVTILKSEKDNKPGRDP
jgi:hypothetical protein